LQNSLALQKLARFLMDAYKVKLLVTKKTCHIKTNDFMSFKYAIKFIFSSGSLKNWKKCIIY